MSCQHWWHWMEVAASAFSPLTPWTSSRMAIGQSTTIGVGPKLTRLMKAVTVSTLVVPIMASCCTHVDIIVAMAVLTKRPGEVISTCGRLIVMQGVSSPWKDLAISANPSSGICFCKTGLLRGLFTHWLKIFGAPVCWLEMVRVEVVAVEGMMRGLEHPRKGVIGKELQGWALWHLLWLQSLMASWTSSSTPLEHQEEVVFTQGKGGSLARTSWSVNVDPLIPLIPLCMPPAGMFGRPRAVGPSQPRTAGP